MQSVGAAILSVDGSAFCICSGKTDIRSVPMAAFAPFARRAAEFLLEFPVEEGHVAVAHTMRHVGHGRGAKRKQTSRLAHALAGKKPLEAAAGLLL